MYCTCMQKWDIVLNISFYNFNNWLILSGITYMYMYILLFVDIRDRAKFYSQILLCVSSEKVHW